MTLEELERKVINEQFTIIGMILRSESTFLEIKNEDGTEETIEIEVEPFDFSNYVNEMREELL